MNHSFASEKHCLGEICQRRVLELLIPAEIPLLDIFMERDVWFQQLQKQIDIYKSNKTPQQNSKCSSGEICPYQESLWQQKNLVRSGGSQPHNTTHPARTEHKQPENSTQSVAKGTECVQRGARSTAINTLPKEVLKQELLITYSVCFPQGAQGSRSPEQRCLLMKGRLGSHVPVGTVDVASPSCPLDHQHN